MYYPGGSVVPAFAAPPVYNRAYSIEADVDIPAGGAEGVLIAQGGDAGGYSFFVKDGQLRFVYNYVGLDRFEVRAGDGGLTEGRHALRYEFEPTGEPDIANGKGVPGRGQLYIDGKLVGSDRLPAHDPAVLRARRAQLRLRLRRPGGRVRAAVPVHGHDPAGRRRPRRRADRRRRGRAPRC